MKIKESLFNYTNPAVSYSIINGDSAEILKKYEDEKFDLIITSPPYNIGKAYEVKKSIEK